MKFNPSTTLIPSPQDNHEELINPTDQSFLQLQTENDDVERQMACLHAWNSLQNDLQQLQQLFVDFNKLIHVR